MFEQNNVVATLVSWEREGTERISYITVKSKRFC